MKKYYGTDLEKQREALLKSKAAKYLVDEVIALADKARGDKLEVLLMSDFALFEETGNRGIYEQKYFKRKSDAAYLSLALWLTRDEKYIKPLTDHIFAICDEYTWCVPAHVSHAVLEGEPTVEDIVESIDLFQAETTRLLCEIMALNGDILPDYAEKRVEYEVRRRVIASLMKKDFWWFDLKSNWCAVCSAGSLAGVLRYGSEEEKAYILPKLYSTIENFIDGFGDDGCCEEGYSYWCYGFGQFMVFESLISDYTNGKKDYFSREKVKKMALFPQRARMGTNRNVCFSDSGNSFTFSPAIMCRLKSVYPETLLPDLKYASSAPNIYSALELLWFDADYKADGMKNETTYFENVQWYIKSNEKFSFAAKAGHNDEQHNHNDVGSFMIVVGDKIPLEDFGKGIYKKETFENETRYKMLHLGSMGHSVPVINGEYQLFGREYSSENVSADGNVFEFDMQGAYEKGAVNKLHRRFEVLDSSVILEDTYEYSDITESIAERMVSHIKPKMKKGIVDFGTAKVHYDRTKYTAECSVGAYRNTEDTEDLKSYLVDFKAIDPKETVYRFEIKID